MRAPLGIAVLLATLAFAAAPLAAQTLHGGVSEDASPASDGYRVNGECLEACRLAEGDDQQGTPAFPACASYLNAAYVADVQAKTAEDDETMRHNDADDAKLRSAMARAQAAAAQYGQCRVLQLQARDRARSSAYATSARPGGPGGYDPCANPDSGRLPQCAQLLASEPLRGSTNCSVYSGSAPAYGQPQFTSGYAGSCAQQRRAQPKKAAVARTARPAKRLAARTSQTWISGTVAGPIENSFIYVRLPIEAYAVDSSFGIKMTKESQRWYTSVYGTLTKSGSQYTYTITRATLPSTRVLAPLNLPVALH